MKKLSPNEISNEFQGIVSVDDLAKLLQKIYLQNFSRSFKKEFKITNSLLSYYAFVIDKSKRYDSFKIPKKGQSYREISSPIFTLKIIQKCLNEMFSAIYFPKAAVNGFVKNRSIVDNAKRHTKKKYVYNIDIKDFFPSTKFGRVLKVLEGRPFLLKGERARIGVLISSICCNDGCLPQGSPTSPILTNIICRRIDSKFMDLAKINRAQYSRYADDITFSCQKNIFDETFYGEIESILKIDGYEINTKKIRLQDWKQRQMVTGLIVNKRVNVSREFLKDIRYWIFQIEKRGLGIAQMDFEKKYHNKKGHLRYGSNKISISNYLEGKIQFLQMVRGKTDKVVMSLWEKYNKSVFGIAKKTDVELQPFENERKNEILVLSFETPIVSSISYDFISGTADRDRLRETLIYFNQQMEFLSSQKFIADNGMTIGVKETFIKFVFHAYFQVERLLNWYYYLKSDYNKNKSISYIKVRAEDSNPNWKWKGANTGVKIRLFLIWDGNLTFRSELYNVIIALGEIRNIYAHPENDFHSYKERDFRKSNLSKMTKELLKSCNDYLLVKESLIAFVALMEKELSVLERFKAPAL